MAFQTFGYLNPTGSSTASVLWFIHALTTGLKDASAKTLVRELVSRSLVDSARQGETELFSTHPLLREFAILVAEAEDNVEFFNQAQKKLIEAVRKIFDQKAVQFNEQQLQFLDSHYRQLTWIFESQTLKDKDLDIDLALGINAFLHQTYKISESKSFTELLLEKSKELEDASFRAILLKDLCADLFGLNDYSQAIAVGEEACRLYEQIDNFEGKQVVYVNLISLYKIVGDAEKMQLVNEKFMSLLASPEGERRIIGEIARGADSDRQMLKLLDEFSANTALTFKKMQERGITDKVPEDLIHLAYLPMLKIQLRTALNSKPKDFEEIARANHALGEQYFRTNDFKLALNHFKQAYSFARNLGNVGLQVDDLLMVGQTQFRLGSKPKAKGAIEKALSIANSSGNNILKLRCKFDLASFYAKINDSEMAIKVLTEALVGSFNLPQSDWTPQILESLGMIYALKSQVSNEILVVSISHFVWALAEFRSANGSFEHIKAFIAVLEELFVEVMTEAIRTDWESSSAGLGYLSMFYKNFNLELSGNLLEAVKLAETFADFKNSWSYR